MNFVKKIAGKSKAFTVAEIIIALTLIGVIAAMTVPSLNGNINQSRYKTAYKKARTNIYNIAKQEYNSGSLPTDMNASNVLSFFQAMNESLNVKEYVSQATCPFAKETLQTSNTKMEYINFGGFAYTKNQDTVAGTGNSMGSYTDPKVWTPWIVTEDGTAYSLKGGDQAAVYTSQTFNSTTTVDGKGASVIVGVDVNGLRKGPNKLEPQVAKALTSGVKMQRLTGDRYYIFITKDGVADGPNAQRIGARIVEDIP